MADKKPGWFKRTWDGLNDNLGLFGAIVLAIFFGVFQFFPGADTLLISLFVSDTSVQVIPLELNSDARTAVTELNSSIVKYLGGYAQSTSIALFKIFLLMTAVMSLILGVQKKRVEKNLEEKQEAAFLANEVKVRDLLEAHWESIKEQSLPVSTGVDNIQFGVSALDGSVKEVKEAFFSDQKVETIRVGIFDELLAYSPFFVADELGFFIEENLRVVVQPIFADEIIAEKLRAKEIDFGIGDPIFALEEIGQSDERLQILLPMVKRLDITAICRSDLFDDKEKIKDRTIRIVSFSSPSTTHCAAKRLEKELVNFGASVTIVEKSPDSHVFDDRSSVADLFDHETICLLWNPASSWAMQDLAKNHSGEFGLLSLAKTSEHNRKQISNWSVNKIVWGEDGPLVEDPDLKTWNPTVARVDATQLLASALIVSSELVSVRPNLCKRVFKALSRAHVRMAGADWGTEDKYFNNNKPRGPNLITAISGRVAKGADVDKGIIENLLNGKTAMNSMFPFIESRRTYKVSAYQKHLKNLHTLWYNYGSISGRIPEPHKALKSYDKYFVTFDEE